MKAVILAGGRGSRFGSLTLQTPKPLVKVAGKPLIEHTLESLPSLITEIIVVVGYLGTKIVSWLGDEYQGINIKYIHQEKAGTGGALLAAKNDLVEEDYFLVLGSDDIFGEGELEKLIIGEAVYGVHFGRPINNSGYKILFGKKGYFHGFESTEDLLSYRYFGVGAYILPPCFLDLDFHRLSNGELAIPHTFICADFPIKTVTINRWMPVNNEKQRMEAEYVLKNNFFN
jgi:NDP-sugar pyrophosphorylase family protein